MFIYIHRTVKRNRQIKFSYHWGDLAFFYDMNGIWNRYVGKNVRIMLNNNEGAALFHFGQGLNQFPTLNQNVAAEHFATARGG